MQTTINKEDWITMFKDVGLSEETMKKWHHLFETRHPEGHESFLNWLKIPSDEITQIRANSR